MFWRDGRVGRVFGAVFKQTQTQGTSLWSRYDKKRDALGALGPRCKREAKNLTGVARIGLLFGLDVADGGDMLS